MLPQQFSSPSRRHYARFETPEGVWAYWSCGGHCDTSLVRNLSVGGGFIQTRQPVGLGAKSTIDFLIPEGRLRVEALVRHVSGGLGFGLQFTAVEDGDRPQLAFLLNRLSHPSGR